MSKDPRLKPKQIRKRDGCYGDAWWYEDPKGIEVLHQVVDDNGKHLRTEMMVIPWSAVLRAAKRSAPQLAK